MMVKEKHRSKKPDGIPGVEYYTVGKGVGEQKRWRVRCENITPETIEFMKKALPSDRVSSFEGKIVYVEARAKLILERAGLPTDPGGYYTIPDGKPVNIQEPLTSPERRGTLLPLVVARGFREREATEWYAAEILSQIRFVRGRIARGDTATAISEAASLGELVGEAKALGYFARTGAKGGAAERHNPPIGDFVLFLLRRKRSGTTGDLWETIPLDQIDGIHFRGFKFYRNGGRLLAVGKTGGCKDWRPAGKPLKFSAFRKHVTKARKALAL